jgi:predicted AlkP superfamily phosphohydrolase/phosphomutase
MEKIVIEMSNREYQKFLAFKQADKVVKSLKRSLREVQEAKEGKRILKSAYQLANEL